VEDKDGDAGGKGATFSGGFVDGQTLSRQAHILNETAHDVPWGLQSISRSREAQTGLNPSKQDGWYAGGYLPAILALQH